VKYLIVHNEYYKVKVSKLTCRNRNVMRHLQFTLITSKVDPFSRFVPSTMLQLDSMDHNH
jgi:hypothetical protein